MLYEDFTKKIRKLMIDNDIAAKDIAEKLGESQANIIGKINRSTIRLMDAEKILDAIGYEIGLISKETRELLIDQNSKSFKELDITPLNSYKNPQQKPKTAVAEAHPIYQTKKDPE